MITTINSILLWVALIHFIIMLVIVFAIKFDANVKDRLLVTSIVAFGITIVSMIAVVILGTATTSRTFKASDDYDLEQMANTFDVEYHYVENLEEPYIKYQTAFGMKEFDYYLDNSEKPDEFAEFKVKHDEKD